MSDAQEPSPLKTPGFDSRFPNSNQTRHCFQSYVDYHKCINLKGEEFEPCKIFYRTFSSLCPVDWVEKWDDQRGMYRLSPPSVHLIAY
ncbi:hypothetical protein BABINDRAFT_162002 [Babjeviella inositovora NRRL Y-12698]|uniref:Cytochrome c oxidase subunit 12, mitochondrial n=1 Tax=Babjeviella inositovora NRRL Y-12698 TaxID=984486 RepID=A0A1E3QPJ6_9ASCO|nr:uncharacterized protein BABINDRAFT_162002 [Babjeviella inositovora NRRL Y-12698]ODQ79623.1 hypothetical protein BABINDRAFT_162002 [Babjeviella inositovora NRRL Y-12698]